VAAPSLLVGWSRLLILLNAESTVDDIAKPATARYIRPLAQTLNRETMKLGHQILIQVQALHREAMKQDHQILIRVQALRREAMTQNH
jgi:hypothetical protein